jgi:restriction endonuclease S subunit
MLKLDSIEWREFRVRDIFHVTNSKPYHKEQVIKSPNGVPYITRTSINNGLVDTIENSDRFVLNASNSISLGAENADFFYQHLEYVTGNKMYSITGEHINRYVGLFLVMCFRQSIEGAGFGYGKGLTGTRFQNRNIMLPIDSENKPNWVFMGEYMKAIESQILDHALKFLINKSLKTNSKIGSLTPYRWKDFQLGEICNIKSGVRLTKNEMKPGKTPFIGSTDSNNGITEFTSSINSSVDQNVLGVNYNGSVVENFYHPYECIFSDDVKRVELKKGGNKYTYLFLKTIILAQKEKYQYGYKFNAHRMKKQKIQLPINRQGEIDYEFMEQTMKSIEKKQINSIISYFSLKINKTC